MKTMSWVSTLFLLLALAMSTTDLAAQNEEKTDEAVETMETPTVEDVTGTWEIVTSTPRGKRNANFRIVEENGGLVGYGERGDVPVEQEGNVLTWSATIDSPRGAVEVKNTAEVSGDTMEGTVEMLSGPMSGRTLKFSGTRNQ